MNRHWKEKKKRNLTDLIGMCWLVGKGEEKEEALNNTDMLFTYVHTHTYIYIYNRTVG